MSHSYYSDDSEQRKRYFDKHFIIEATKVAQDNRITLAALLSRIVDYQSFVDTLNIIWSRDGSLANYLAGMKNYELREFYERPTIQRIVNNGKVPTINTIPTRIVQNQKKNEEFFRATVKGKLVIARKTSFTRRGNKIDALRDTRGRFVKKS